MKFLILMTDGGGAWELLSAAEQARVVEQHREFRRALEAEGKYVTSHQLAPVAEAKTVRRSADGRTSVLDGPFTESKEVVGGFYIIEADSMAEAVEWARRSRFIFGSNEVRAIAE